MPVYSRISGDPAHPVNLQDKSREKFVPTVFIALGGSGKDVVMRLRKRFYDRYVTRDPRFARFVFVDTDAQKWTPRGCDEGAFAEVVPNQGEKVECPISAFQFNKTFTDLQAHVESERFSWLKLEMKELGPGAVKDGAGTFRQFGRLAFFLNYPAIRQTIDQQIRETLRYATDHPTEVKDGHIEVVIVTSLAGGTGSGMFIDVAYLVRDILAQTDFAGLNGQSTTLIGFLPGLFEGHKNLLPRLQQNAYAALLELEHYGTPRTGDELFLGNLGAGGHPRGTGFVARWDGDRKFISGTGWDTCYLIDNINDLSHNAPLTDAEVFQMAADFLFLDFEQHGFAVAKRSARPNLVQYNQRRKETWVRQVSGGDVSGDVFSDTDVVYATQNGCRFSSFGLAEIYFDLEKLYQAGGYRLASHLVRHRWIGKAEVIGETQYTAWVKDDLLDPKPAADEKVPPSFRPEPLTRRLLTGKSGCWLDVLDRQLDQLREVGDAQGYDALSRLLKEHTGALRPGPEGDRGTARQTLAENRKALEGDATNNLGPLRGRLARLAAGHFSAHGADATIRLLGKYRKALGEVRQAVQAQAKQAAPRADDLLARLREAGTVPPPVKRLALSIEAPRARGAVSGALAQAYRRAAAEEIDPLLVDVGRYVGAIDQPDYPELARHGTLHRRYTEVLKFLNLMADRLDERFDDAHVEKGHHLKRKCSLSVGWDADLYDKRIDEALVVNPNVNRGPDEPGRFHFHWGNFEALVLDRLRARHPELSEARDVAGLFDLWFAHKMTNDQGLVRVCEMLAGACADVLRGSGDAGGFQLDDEEKGNVIDLLCRSPEADLDRQVERMVNASMPYLPTVAASQIASNFSATYSNLYGQKVGENPKYSQKNATTVFDKVRSTTATKSNGQAGFVPPSETGEQSALVLVREVTGFPLQFYSRLDDLHQAYYRTQTYTGSNNECHIDYNESSEDLPDIRILDTAPYELIRANVGYVLRAMILRVVNWKQGSLYVSVPDKFQPGGVDIRLGNRIHRAIKHACEQEKIREFLSKSWSDWLGQAGPRDWAGLYASGMKTWADLTPEVKIQHGKVKSSPLRNCYQNILEQAKAKLESTAEGRRWLAALSSREPLDDGDGHGDGGVNVALNGDTEGTFAQRVERECLQRISTELPVYQVLTKRLAQVTLPEPTGEVVAGP